MRSAFDQAAVIQHQNLIGMHDGREPMRDDQLRAPFASVGEVADDFGFGSAVERGCRFVEDKDARVLQVGACDRQALALPA